VNDTLPPHPDQAVLFADISGSTRLYETLGDARAFTTINNCLSILQRLTTAHHGQNVKTIGDEIMAVFPDAVSAVQAACEMQLVISHARIDGTQLSIRIGFHYGPVIAGDGDVFGETVNIAARMTEIAQAQQIITTGTTVAMLPPIMRTSTRSFDNLPVKGKTDDIEVHEVIWQETEEMTMMVGRTLTPASAEPTLELIYRGNKFVMDAARPVLTIGRGELADIVIHDRRASRMHARIERRRDKFVFVDLSSNGSYVTFSNEGEVQLRREELVLRESGVICLGHTYKKDPVEVIAFTYIN
jgi:class 3 adenylate cyclase